MVRQKSFYAKNQGIQKFSKSEVLKWSANVLFLNMIHDKYLFSTKDLYKK